MNRKTHIKTESQNKVQSINNSINLMTDCVKYLEKIRSYNYVSAINEEELQKVLEHLHEIEESIEKIQSPQSKPQNNNILIKAIGKDRKLWVTKPTYKDESKLIPEPRFTSNQGFSKHKTSS